MMPRKGKPSGARRPSRPPKAAKQDSALRERLRAVKTRLKSVETDMAVLRTMIAVQRSRTTDLYLVLGLEEE